MTLCLIKKRRNPSKGQNIRFKILEFDGVSRLTAVVFFLVIFGFVPLRKQTLIKHTPFSALFFKFVSDIINFFRSDGRYILVTELLSNFIEFIRDVV